MSYQSMTIPRRRREPSNINTIEHFASSYSRAQSFLAIDPVQEITRSRSYLWDDDDDSGSNVPENAVVDDESFLSYPASPERSTLLSSSAHVHRTARGSIVSSAASYPGIQYTSAPPKGTTVVGQTAVHSIEGDAVIVRKLEDEQGRVTTGVAGQSTAPQTVFNSVNVLIGVGLLSLSLGFKYCGWVLGTFMMIVSALATFYSAKLLAKCLDSDATIVTYADIGHAAFGSQARALISILFTLELTGASVSLVVLFADSLNALIPSVTRTTFKWIAFFILTPACFAPLKILSFSSILGIICTMSVVCIVLFNGLFKTQGQPGSLWHPMPTWLWPGEFQLVCLSIGLFMSPWSGHAVFPNIYRDMRHPAKYDNCLRTTYYMTFAVDMTMAVLGFLMYGETVLDEVTKNIMQTEGVPRPTLYIMTILLGLIPLAKTPLNAQPIISMFDTTFGVHYGNELRHKLIRSFIRIGTVLMFVIMGIIFPEFDKIMSLVGSMLCTTICLILPLAFYLKIYNKEIKFAEKVLDWFLLIVFSALAALGTFVSLTIS